MLGYRNLEVWQRAKELAIVVYRLTKEFPMEEKYALASQINRAVISIASNLAEGTSRSSPREQARFTEIAYGSLMETACQIDIANELGYLNDDTHAGVLTKIEELAVKITKYRKSQVGRSRSDR